MTSLSSNLSDRKYGYDVVVSVTQASINATIKTHLINLREPETKVCFVADDANVPVLIPVDELIAKTGVDPFEIEAKADPATDLRIAALTRVRFMAGFKARLGVPYAYTDPDDIPDYVELEGGTSSVSFCLLCETFEIVEFDPGGYGSPKWTRLEQNDGTPWAIKSRVDLRLSTLEESQYSKLPQEAQKAIKGLSGEPFSIRQLLFDFTNAGLSSEPPKLEGIAPGTKLYMLLSQYFVGAYFSTLTRDGSPMLSSSITGKTRKTNRVLVSDLDFQVNPLLDGAGKVINKPTPDQKRLITLSYLCATKNILPKRSPFVWNWVTAKHEADCHGIVAMNRDQLTDHLESSLYRAASQNCMSVKVKQSWKGTSIETKVKLTRGGVNPEVFRPYPKNPIPGLLQKDRDGLSIPTTILQMKHSSSDADQSGINGALSKVKVSTTYDMSITLVDKNKIVVMQKLKFNLLVRGNAGVQKSANVIDQRIKTTFELGVSGSGQLTATPTSKTTDKSAKLKFNDWETFWGGSLQDVSDQLSDGIAKFGAATISDVPLSAIRNLVFPGGRTFAFKDPQFSDHHDLVAQITYADVV